MVAISLYRGNLHRVPSDVPRRWLMPTPCISIKDFRRLLFRRSKALSLLASSSSVPTTTPTTALSNPNPNPNSVPSDLKPPENPNFNPRVCNNADVNTEDVVEKSSPLDPLSLVVDVNCKTREGKDEKGKEIVQTVAAVNNPMSTTLQANEKSDTVHEKEKRKKEVEEKLHILNEKKHNLVQALKQILNAEEELKRRSSMQTGRPPLPLQVDASNDSGSMTRHNTPRTGSDANLTVEIAEGEGDDAVNNNQQSRQLLRMNSTSPSAESALRRAPHFQHNVASYPSRAALVAAGSPSRFAPPGNQGHPSNLPTVSVSGTNYLPSSPSPAASGGTSGFRDARHPSPWN